jgi:hypothetical protein
MKKVFLIVLLSVAVLTISRAQEESEKKGFDKSRLFIGGSLGLSFSSYGSAINVTPQVGYFFNRYFAAGVGVNYAYYSYKDYYGSTQVSKQSYSYAGMNIFGRVYPIRQAFVQVQPELNYIWGSVQYAGSGGEYKIPSQFVPSLLLGGGAALPAGKGSVVISIMYDVIQNTLSPYYGQAVYAFGYNIGF